MDSHSSPAEVRAACRSGRWDRYTAGLAADRVQANLVVLPRALAYDFLVFCHRNPRPCPLLDVTDAGSPVPSQTAADADLRTDLPRYRVYRNGELVEECSEITDLWSDELVAFLLGCSFTFEGPLLDASVPMRHIDAGTNVPMYQTNIPCAPAGTLAGPMVVSLRMIPSDHLVKAVQVTSRFPNAHGAPIHVGDPGQIGINDLDQPDWGDPPVQQDGDVPVFWACGVTPQAIAIRSQPEFMITHAPGHMFVTDLRVDDLAVL